jgi:outer membrane protein assembly factor BamB
MSLPPPFTAPVQTGSPWPTFRHDPRNSGRSALPAIYQGDRPWAFQTGKGVFSTPVIDGHGIIYVGSGDHTFYALHPDGTVKWKYKTGEIIDSAAALCHFNAQTGDTVVFL